MWFAILLASTAFAFQVPAGWTPQGENRAVLDATNPALGEIREITVAGGKGDPAELVKVLKAEGIQATVTGTGPTTTLLTNDSRIIQARASVSDGKARWYVVMASKAATAQLDVNALLTTLQSQIPVHLNWGEAVEVLPAGGDGTLWNGPREAERPQWGEGDPETTWGKDALLYGLWAGTTLTKGSPTEVRLWMEANGRVRLERVLNGGTSVSEGTWGVREGQIRLAWYTSEPLVTGYKCNGKVLSFSLDERMVEFKKIK